MARSTARAAAMQLIYEQMMGGAGGDDTLLGMLQLNPSEDDMAYLTDVVSGVHANQGELDEAIEKHWVDWTLARLARVDLAILRLACYEMKRREDIPASVSINEAVELAHMFSTPEAASFVNGVLGSLLRSGDLPQGRAL